MKKVLLVGLVALIVGALASPFYYQKKVDEAIAEFQAQSEMDATATEGVKWLEHNMDYGWFSGTGKTLISVEWKDYQPNEAEDALVTVNHQWLIPLEHKVSFLPWGVESETRLATDRQDEFPWIAVFLEHSESPEAPALVKAQMGLQTAMAVESQALIAPFALIGPDAAIKFGKTEMTGRYDHTSLSGDFTLDTVRVASPGADVSQLSGLSMNLDYPEWHQDDRFPIGKFSLGIEQISTPFAQLENIRFVEKSSHIEAGVNDYQVKDAFSMDFAGLTELPLTLTLDLTTQWQETKIRDLLPALGKLDSHHPETLIQGVEAMMGALAEANVKLHGMKLAQGEAILALIQAESYFHPELATETALSPQGRLMVYTDAEISAQAEMVFLSNFLDEAVLTHLVHQGVLIQEDGQYKGTLVLAHQKEPTINNIPLSVVQQRLAAPPSVSPDQLPE